MHPASNTKRYVADKGEKLYRRSLYVYWKRTSPHPMMTLFDAPSRESSCVKRSRTNTSLQSLGLFNETQRVEMGRKPWPCACSGMRETEAGSGWICCLRLVWPVARRTIMNARSPSRRPGRYAKLLQSR